jgi:hypothetical protein
MSKPAQPKFTQIACSTSHNNDGVEKENLYALDTHGRVWWYRFPPVKEEPVGWVLLLDDIHEPLSLPGPGPQGPTSLVGRQKK